MKSVRVAPLVPCPTTSRIRPLWSRRNHGFRSSRILRDVGFLVDSVFSRFVLGRRDRSRRHICRHCVVSSSRLRNRCGRTGRHRRKGYLPLRISAPLSFVVIFTDLIAADGTSQIYPSR